MATINALAEQSGSTWRSVKKWLAEAGITASDPTALEVIKARKSVNESEQPDNWQQRKVRAEALKLERENRIQDRLENETYMLYETVEKMVVLIAGKLELIPVKMESEFGWPDKQTKRLQQLIDEARDEMAAGIAKLEDAEKLTA